VNRLRKYIERSDAGQELRTAYALTAPALPDPRPRSQWREETTFSAADEVLANPELKSVIKTAIQRGFALLPETGLKKEK
jgi:hypothetical protein